MLERIKLFFELALVVAVVGIGCGEEREVKREEHKEGERSPVVKLSQVSIKEIGLQTEIALQKPFTRFITIPAQVLANQDNEAQVGSLVQGRVYKVFVKVGDKVKAGQELMQVEGLEIGEIKAAFLSAKANLEFQKANFERQKTLIDQKIGSQKSFLEAQAEYEKALAGYNAEDKRIHSIGLDDEDIITRSSDKADEHTSGTLPVKSPISGTVVERNVVIGQFVEGNTNAFKIINTSLVWIDGQIYEKDINQVNEKTNVVFTSASYPNEKFIGKINYIGQTIDEYSRTITIRADFNNLNGKLKPQMFGELQIPTGKNSIAILIPAESVIKINNADFIFVQKNDSTFEKRSVVMGSIQDEMAEIKEGLREKEKVVVKGSFYLKSALMKEELMEDEH